MIWTDEDELTFSCRLSFKEIFRICICSLYWSIWFCKAVWFLHPCLTRSSRAFRSLDHTTFAPSCLSVRACISLRHWLAPFISGEVAHTTIMMSEMIDHRARQAITMLRVVWEDLELAILNHTVALRLEVFEKSVLVGVSPVRDSLLSEMKLLKPGIPLQAQLRKGEWLCSWCWDLSSSSSLQTHSLLQRDIR